MDNRSPHMRECCASLGGAEQKINPAPIETLKNMIPDRLPEPRLNQKQLCFPSLMWKNTFANMRVHGSKK